jgi:eukaryotic-like serine/threonine-protein kinase
VRPRIAIVGQDAQQRQWLRHHLQALWSGVDPPGLEPEQYAQQLHSAAGRHFDITLLCVDFDADAAERCAGLALLKRLRRLAQLPTLIVIAGGGNELTAARATRLGAAAYLPRKLVDAQRLGGTVRRVLHASQRQRRRAARRAPATAGARTSVAVPTIPGYTLLRQLGSSTRASVWLARSDALERPVALKVSTPEHGESSSGPQFAREYAAIAAMRSPAIVDIYDYGVHDGREFIAMEYFPCGDLKQRLLHPLDSHQALVYARRIAAALCVTHAAGIVHRDLKPPNVMLRADGSVVLIDFGLAKQLDANTHSTAIGVLRGSPYYMSPEQVQAQTLDGRSDIYSLGVVLYEMLTGHKPFHGLTAMDLMQQHVSGERPPLPPEHGRFEPLLRQLMAREREQRYADAPAALAALEALAAELGAAGDATPIPAAARGAPLEDANAA